MEWKTPEADHEYEGKRTHRVGMCCQTKVTERESWQTAGMSELLGLLATLLPVVVWLRLVPPPHPAVKLTAAPATTIMTARAAVTWVDTCFRHFPIRIRSRPISSRWEGLIRGLH